MTEEQPRQTVSTAAGVIIKLFIPDPWTLPQKAP